jgi:putative membrane protein
MKKIEYPNRGHLITDYFVDGFKVPSFFTAFLFSIILSISQSVLNKIFVD